jgi:hypothetical protein
MKNKKILVELLQKQLNESETMWKSENKNFPYIIGYLQGMVKIAITELDEEIKTTKKQYDKVS